MKTSRLLPWIRSWSHRVPILHGILIAQLIMLPSSTSRGVWVDVDSDGDGIFDTGYDDGTSPPDTTPPPEPEPIIDSDGDNLSDADEAAAGSNPYSPDSDGDGVTDADEVNLTGTDPTSSDSDGDGISDYNEFYGNTAVDEDTSGPGETPYDYDGDGIADPVDPDPLSPQNDPDSDGDYVPDSQDSDPYNPAVWNDANGNGINDDAEVPNNDTDGDGVSNDTDSHPADPWLNNDWNFNGQNDGDEDADGDGVSNLQDSHPNSNCLWCDWNGNGVNDDVEAGTADSDGDNIADNADSHPFNNGLWEDWNSNGTNDSAESANADGDAQPDFSDSDPQDFNLWEDWDHNGINDSFEPPPNPDRDNDLMPNENDSDPDNGALWCDWNRNGINDTEEQPPMDSDGDGHPDNVDSHPGNSFLWEDWNYNGYNDSTEDQYLDDDNDSHPNAFDTHPQDATLWNDHNGNGINDENETTITDTDGDGYNDDLDTHPSNANLWNDHNSNGINDELELPPDRDGDSIADANDEFPDDFDNDGLTDADELFQGTDPASNDTDGDGLRDGEEVYAGTDLLNVDTDGDGLTDFEELRAYQTDPLTPTTITTGDAPPPADSGTPPLTSAGGTTSNLQNIPTAPQPQVLSRPTVGFYALNNGFWNTDADIIDGDGDGIPDRVEQMYSPLIVTPDGDLDGDGLSNLDEYNAGKNMNQTTLAGDTDGDWISDTTEDAWGRIYPSLLNKYWGWDAVRDHDGDGLLTVEELNGTFGSPTSPSLGTLKFCTDPTKLCSGPNNVTTTVTYNVPAPRTPPTSFATYGTSEAWKQRPCGYTPWMTDGSIRLAYLATPVSQKAAFFTAALKYTLPATSTYKPGTDHVPQGYLNWLAANHPTWPATPTGGPVIPLGGLYNYSFVASIPPIPSSPNQQTIFNAMTGWEALTALTYDPTSIYYTPRQPRVIPGQGPVDLSFKVTFWGHIRQLMETYPALLPDMGLDEDGDMMHTWWEHRYKLNFRSNADAGPLTQCVPIAVPVKPVGMSQAAYLASPIYQLYLNRNVTDPDHDGLGNLLEYRLGLNPLLADFQTDTDVDTDGDGFSDGVELLNFSDPSLASSVPPISIEVVRGSGQTIVGGQWAAPLVVRARQVGGNTFTDVTFTSNRGGLFRHAIFGDEGPSVTVSTAYNVGETAALFQAPLTAGSVIITATVPSGGTAEFLLTVTAPPGGGGGGGGGPPNPNPNPNPVNFTLNFDAPGRKADYTTGIFKGPDGTTNTVGWGSYMDSTLPAPSGGGNMYTVLMRIHNPQPPDKPADSFEETWNLTSYPSLNTPQIWGFGALRTSYAYFAKYSDPDPELAKMGGFTAIGLTKSRVRLRSDVILPQGHTVKCLVIEETSNLNAPAGTSPTVKVLKVIDCTIPPGMDVSQEINLKTAYATLNTSASIWLRPCDLFTDINNDGELTLADASLAAKAYTGSASDPETEKAVEYLFFNDELSNGAWDREDPDAPPTVPNPNNPTGPPIPLGDDDAELLNAKPGITDGEAWFEHPAIGGISFYRDKGCTDKITELSGGTTMTFDLSSPAKNWPASIYMRADGTIQFDPENPQFEGDLVLMTKPKGAASAVEAARMKLTIIKDLGAKNYFHGARDYIMENNARFFAHDKLYGSSRKFRLCMMREEGSTMYPIDTYNRATPLAGIDAVIGAYPQISVAVNGNICFFSFFLPLPTAGDMTDKCHGGMIRNAVWDAAVSSHDATKSSLAGNDAKYVAQYDQPKRYDFTKGRVPEFPPSGIGAALGGLSTNPNEPDRIDREFQMIGYFPGSEQGKGIVFTATQIVGDGGGAVFIDDAKDSGVPTNAADSGRPLVFLLDGGTSTAVAHANPDDQMKVIVKGPKHSWAYKINTYLLFSSVKPRAN